MQFRTEPITGRNTTRFTAMAAKFNGTDGVHIGLSERRGLDVRIKSESGWQLVDFELTNFWQFNGISIYKPNGTEVSITVILDAGIAFTVEEANGVMSIIFVGSETMKGSTRGLLGTWNDDTNDDFLTPSGDILDANSTLREIHYNFGQLWSIESQDALFYYEPGKDHGDYSDPTFVPLFVPPNNVDTEEIQRICGDIFECMFEYQVTGDPEIAQATRTSVEDLNVVMESSAPVVACPFAHAPTNGTKNGISNIEGSHLEFACDPGFHLLGSDDIVCQANGTWSNDPPVCYQIGVCPFVPAPTNGTKNGTSNIEGSHLEFACDPGFHLLGSDDIVCQANWTWSNDPPVCYQIAVCPFVPAPTNGTKNGTSNIEESHLEFACDPGFHLLGSDDIVCQANGTWSNDVPICYQSTLNSEEAVSLFLIIGVPMVIGAVVVTISIVLICRRRSNKKNQQKVDSQQMTAVEMNDYLTYDSKDNLGTTAHGTAKP